MRAIVWAVLLAAVAAGSAAARPREVPAVRVLAVAPFFDENPLNRRIADLGSARLSELLKGGRLQIVDAARVAAELRRQGLTPIELISPSKTIAVGWPSGWTPC